MHIPWSIKLKPSKGHLSKLIQKKADMTGVMINRGTRFIYLWYLSVSVMFANTQTSTEQGYVSHMWSVSTKQTNGGLSGPMRCVLNITLTMEGAHPQQRPSYSLLCTQVYKTILICVLFLGCFKQHYHHKICERILFS